MTALFKEKVLEDLTAAFSGTGAYQLNGPRSGYRGFVAAHGNGAVVGYHATTADGTVWETGFGTVTDAATDTISRNLLESSTGSLISWVAGAGKVIYQVPIAAVLGGLVESNQGGSRPTWLPPKGQWLNSTAATRWGLNVYDGAADIKFMDIDSTNDRPVLPGSAFIKYRSQTGDLVVANVNKGEFIECNKATAMAVTLPAVASVDSDFYMLLKITQPTLVTVTPNGAETIDGVNAATRYKLGDCVVFMVSGAGAWKTAQAQSEMRRIAQGSTYTVALADLGEVVDATAAITINLPTIASSGEGFYGFVFASGGAATLDPNGAELVEGQTTLVVPQNEFVLYWNNGTEWKVRRFGLWGDNVVVISGTTHSPTQGDHGCTFVYTNAGAIAVTLPAMTAIKEGWKIKAINKSSGGDVTFTRSGSDAVDGGGTAFKLQRFDGLNQLSIQRCNSTWFTSTRFFRSAEVALPAANTGATAQAHGLGAIPVNIQTFIKNTITDVAYAVGDIMPIQSLSNTSGAAANYEFYTVPDATNVSMVITGGSLGRGLANKTTGAVTNLTPADWNYFYIASYPGLGAF